MKKTILAACAAALCIPAFSQTIKDSGSAGSITVTGGNVTVTADKTVKTTDMEVKGDTVIIRTETKKEGIPFTGTEVITTTVVTKKADGAENEVVTEVKKAVKKKHGKSGFTAGGVSMGINAYADHNFISGAEGDEFLALNTTKSINFVLNAVTLTMPVTRGGTLNMVTGVWLDWGNYRFENDMTIVNNNGMTEASGEYIDRISKSKLVTLYVDVPLMLRLRFPVQGEGCGDKSFWIEGGVTGGMKLGSHTKIKYTYNGDKEKNHDSFNLNLLRWNLTMRAGYGVFGIYGRCQMNPMFESGHGPEVYPYAVGFTVGF